ncbi:class II histone deacetylase [Halomarina halobia]|uniref:Class II histone deacetylase n=1 Tax=Halomarina halobia TaxID=3033386 RepID=A0ABD6AEJ3_9EURY|nr:class II histone deacetylase [Halomarina sp. PSR21]
MSAASELVVYFDEVFIEHEAPDGAYHFPPHDLLAVTEPHPDRPERLINIRHAIKRALADVTTWEAVVPATSAHLERVHEVEYLAYLKQRSAEGSGRLNPATGVNEATFEAARHATGAAIQTAERALTGGPDEVPYALVRPSGHHAQPATADGYCYLNNLAVAAAHARATGRAERIAIVDWDVHHGNGTQEIFYDRSDVLTISVHNDFGAWGPHHPQTGRANEQGVGEGIGYNVNVPVPPGTGDRGYAYVFDAIVEPILEVFEPELLLVGAGQDSGQIDPNGRNLLTKEGFHDLGCRMRELAAHCAGGSLGIVQEGGYQLSHLPFGTLGVLEGVLNVDTGVEDPFTLLEEYLPPVETWTREAGAIHAHHWPLQFDPASDK